MLHIIFKLTDDVTKKKLEYQKNLEMYKLMRSRFEEYYVKCKYYIQDCLKFFQSYVHVIKK